MYSHKALLPMVWAEPPMDLGKSKYTYQKLPPETRSEPDPASAPAEAEADAEQRPSVRLSPPAVRTLTPLAPVREPELKRVVPTPPRESGSRNMVVLVSAAVGLLALGSYLALRKTNAATPRPVEIVDHLDLSELSALPGPLQAGAQAVMAGNYQAPAWRQSMDRGSGGELGYPVQEAVEELSPTLEWKFEAPSINVAVISPTHQLVARAEVYRDTHWTVAAVLERGAVYIWEVNTLGQVRRNSFRVIDETEEGWLRDLRLGQHGESHLVMGMAYLEIGMFSKAQQEFRSLAEAHPHSPEAAQLLRTVNGLVMR